MTEWREYRSDSEYFRGRHLDPSCVRKVSAMVELYEKVWSDVRMATRRPGIEGARARRMPGTIHENMHWSSGLCRAPALISTQLLDLLRLTLVTDHE
jgi:predicted metal-dependent RNase